MRKVLAVDDEPAILQVYITLLNFNGYKALKANNGQEAWKVIQTDIPEVVITDLAMPIMDGVELIEKIRSDSRLCEIPIVVISGTPELLDHRDFKDVHVFKKPVSFKLILKKIKELD